MAKLTETSREYVKNLEKSLPVSPNEVFKILEGLKQNIEAKRLQRIANETKDQPNTFKPHLKRSQMTSKGQNHG